MSRSKEREAERVRSRKQLRRMLRPGKTVYTVLRHVSSSGMTRRIDLYCMWKGEMAYLSHYAAEVMGDRIHAKSGIVVGGCGMDMGFHLVYNLSATLWPKGFKCAGKGCPSNDHSNSVACVRDGKRAHGDGGYALVQRWL